MISYVVTYCEIYLGASRKHVGYLIFTSNILGIPLGLYLGSLCDRYQVHKKVYLLSHVISLICFSILLIPTLIESDGHSLSYQLSVFVILGLMLLTFQNNMSETFCANVAFKTNASYGSMRSYGSLGFLLTSLLLYYTDTFTNSWPKLLPHLLLLIILTIITLVIVTFWPDTSSFDLTDSNEDTEGLIESQGPIFSFRRYLRSGKTLETCRSDLQIASICSDDSIFTTKVNMKLTFDTDSVIDPRRLKRFSLIPLENSYYINKDKIDEQVSDHFTHITKIAPIDQLTLNQNNHDFDIQLEKVYDYPGDSRIEDDEGTITFAMSMRILGYILLRDNLLTRFLAIYFVCGIAEGIINYYFVDFVEYLDPVKGINLSALIIGIAYGSEMVAYWLSNRITKYINSSNALSIVLFTYGLRYSLHLVFLTNNRPPLKFLAFVEVLHCVTTGLFNCVFYVSAMEFSSMGLNSARELIESSPLAKVKNSKELIRRGLKFTMLNLSSCCYDGLGPGLGTLAGGYILDYCGFQALWIAIATIMYTSSLINFLFTIFNTSR